MPAGLDGNPNPIQTAERDAVLCAVADRVCTANGSRVLVGIDGRSGAGKSTFADELGSALRLRGRIVIRSTTDSFHRPRDVWLERGLTSADGYFLDSHQLDRIVSELLIPFQQGADEVLISAFDEPTDTTLESVVGDPSNAVLVFDGLFLHRDEFANLWDMSVYLDADERRDVEWVQFLLDDLPLNSTKREQNSTIDSRPPGGPGTDTVGPPTWTISGHAVGRPLSLTTTTSPTRETRHLNTLEAGVLCRRSGP